MTKANKCWVRLGKAIGGPSLAAAKPPVKSSATGRGRGQLVEWVPFQRRVAFAAQEACDYECDGFVPSSGKAPNGTSPACPVLRHSYLHIHIPGHGGG